MSTAKFGDYTQVEKLDLTSKDILSDNIAKIGQLFPEVLTESSDENGRLRPAIDFDKLRQFLSREIVEGRESYEFTWVGKRGAIAEAGKPTSQTLRPDLEESVDFDKSENVFITGDNLEVLKVLQESYLGKIDMIYIDPPYNTGQDFVYSDKFQISKGEMDEATDSLDETGQRLVKNEKFSARYHSDWLNMMYPRLVLARNLLKDSGVIFISIDDNEQANLKAICDEIFGEENYISTICVETSSGVFGMKAKHVDRTIVKSKDYVHVYSKQHEIIRFSPIYTKSKKMFDTHFTFYKKGEFECQFNEFLQNSELVNSYANRLGITNNIANLHFMMSVFPDVKNFILSERENIYRIRDYTLKISNDEKELLKDGKKHRINNYYVYQNEKGKLLYLYPFSQLTNITSDYKSELTSSVLVGDLWKSFNEDMGNIGKEGDVKFSNGKKPVRLIKNMLKIVGNKNMKILDFFAGSATTAHAVMQLNAEDGGNRKYILCTLDEQVADKSAAKEADYETIDQISRERIRRAAKKIQEEHPETVGKQDFGFRAYKLDASNFKEVSQTPDSFSQDSLFDSVSNIKDGRTDLDLLFQIMLTWGMELSLPIVKTQIDGTDIYNVAGGALIACFADEISESILRQIAKEEPLRAVFKDESFANSAAKINLGQIFKEEAPNTKVKVV
ncbi:site-specific DNA-methyltransferase [Streptococcus suis]|nr:site-specific DNA-methyltransferase [Streptococcus suis]HEM4279024.1 site-specific DNA-methyltransferase [Streptococcus suis]